MQRNLYLTSTLPALMSFGSAPPINRQHLFALVTAAEGPVDIVRLLLLGGDLLQREAVLSEEITPEQLDTVVLSMDDTKSGSSISELFGAEPMDRLEPEQDRVAADQIWARYFYRALRISRDTRSEFLHAWVELEVGLRNALVEQRARILNLDPGPYLVAPELAGQDISFEAVLQEWSAAENPLLGQKALDRFRWDWLTEHEEWFSFSDDEIAAYTAKLMLLIRWQRFSESA